MLYRLYSAESEIYEFLELHKDRIAYLPRMILGYEGGLQLYRVVQSR